MNTESPKVAQTGRRQTITRKVLNLVLAAAFLITLVVLYQVFLKDILSLDSVLQRLSEAKETLATYTRANIWWLFLAAMASYCLVTAILLPSVSWLSITISYAFGAAFGVWPGALVATAAVYLGVLAGLPLVYLLVKYVVGDRLYRQFGGSIDRLSSALKDDAFFYIIAMRLIPIVPYVLVNAAPALIRVKLSTHMLATAIGVIPGTFVYSYLGASLTTAVNQDGLQVSWQILAAFVGLGLLSLLPIVLKRVAPKLFDSQGA